VLNDPSQAPAVYQQFTGKPGVYGVKYPGQQIKTMQSVIHILQWVFLSVAVVLLLSASVLILNTIRMAIFARRREVSVMKLVGATNWFIRVPFMSEGLIQGFFGSAIAAGVVYVIYLFVNHASGGGTNSNLLTAMRMTGWEVVSTNIVVVIIGMAIGSIGSAIAIRRFLDV
jgi:cell division transport system permease protein